MKSSMFSADCQGVPHMRVPAQATEGMELGPGTSETDLGLDLDVSHKRNTRPSHAGLLYPHARGVSEDK